MKAAWWTGKSILVTGASGTVGQGLIRALLEGEPKVLRAFDAHEHSLFMLQQKYHGKDERLRWLLGDVRDPDRLQMAMEGVDLVFHFAALKHVALGEYNPFEIVRTNLFGFQNVIRAALNNNVEKVLFTSSDKAVNPTNAMGASKLMGERLVAAANEMRGKNRTRFASVRFGNILGSNGSVIEVFEKQIERGGPVTLTDRRMTRFVMTLPKAICLVLQAAEMSLGGEVFVLKMPVMKIEDLAEVMIQHLAPKYGYNPQDIPIVEVGAKRGEKMYEEVLMETEVPLSYEGENHYVYLGDRAAYEAVGERTYLQSMTPLSEIHHSGQMTALSHAGIEELLVQLGILTQDQPVEAAR